MAYSPKTWGADEAITAAKLNQCKDSLNWLYAALAPVLKASCEAKTDLGFYVVDFSGSNLVDPSAANGSGPDGASWVRLWSNAYGFAMEVSFPSDIFSSAPLIVGQSVGSGGQWGLVVCAHWDETASKYRVAFRDTGGSYEVTGPFAYNALLLGPRKSNPY